MTELLDQDIQNQEQILPQESQIETPIENNEQQPVEHKKFSFEERKKLQDDWIDKNVPEEDRELLKKYNYAPPEMFVGKDRYGKPVQPKTPEEFKRDFIDPIEKGGRKNFNPELEAIKRKNEEMEASIRMMKDALEMQTKTNLDFKEREITEKINQAKYDQDFDAYEKHLKDLNDIQKRKSQFETQQIQNQPVSLQPQQNQSRYTPTYEDTVAIDTFKQENRDFVNKVLNNDILKDAFDRIADTIRAVNPRLGLNEVMNAAKRHTQENFPEVFTTPTQQKTFMNNQYSATQQPIVNNTTQQRVSYEEHITRHPHDRYIIKEMQATTHLGKTNQQIVDELYSGFKKK